jgi:uncharacterized membrane protein
MSALETLMSGPWGSAFAIGGMALVTFLCRIAGMVLMSRIAITPKIERGLRALPGSIIMATILPAMLDSGPTAVAGVAVAVLTMALTRIDMLSLAAGLGTIALFRALGV